MTGTVNILDYPTKKSLREQVTRVNATPALADHVRYVLHFPWGEQPCSLHGMGVGTTVIVTNHPKRTWFAEITRVSPTEWRIK